MVADLLNRKSTHFILWAPKPGAQPPRLILGELQLTNPVSLANEQSIAMTAVAGIRGLWQVAPTAALQAGKVYHYWFEVDDTKPGRPQGQRIRVTDPAAFIVDWRLRAPALPLPNTDVDRQPAAVIKFDGSHLVPCDPGGETATEAPDEPPLDHLPPNNQIVIYEMPTAWTRISPGGGVERGVGSFQDVLALIEPSAEGANFSDLEVTRVGRSYLGELGVNTLELLPPEDSALEREWGYATTDFFAPDFDFGFPLGNSSPTAHRDLSALIAACHRHGIRVFADMVMAFWRDGPYEHIDADDFHIFDPANHQDDPDALTSTRGFGRKEVRNNFGSTLIRYAKFVDTYDPIDGGQRSLSPANRFMLAHLEHWMREYRIDGVRMDSVENVYNWDFVGAFTRHGRELLRERWNNDGLTGNADARFLVIGEELSLPFALFEQKRLDALWNDRFRELIRAAILGQSAGGENFEGTVRKAIDCRGLGFDDGARAVNYLTSHDVEGFRKERLWNFLGSSGIGNIDERKKRIKLGFTCLLTAVGIPMILAGEEFGDEHDRFDAAGHVTQDDGKQLDPVNYSRAEDPSRSGLVRYVSRLVKLRTGHPALSVNDTEFIHIDFTPGRRVLVWRRGSVQDPVVVVANFSDFASEHTPQGVAEYRVPNWPPTPPGKRWRDVSQDRDIPPDFVGRESLFAWEAKVYALV
jgi:pullulanase